MVQQESRLELVGLLRNISEHLDDGDAAVEIAKRLLIRSQQLQTPQERRQQAELDRMINHPSDKATLVEMTDQAFRTHSAARVADQLTHLLDLQGIPRFFSPLEQTMLRGFQSFGSYLPGVAVPLVKEKMRQETANVILPAEDEMLQTHLRARQEEGVRMNVNFLGEALLGEKEADRRLNLYLHALQTPAINCISVKLSTLYSQVNPVARESTVRVVSDRLELLYRAACRESYVEPSGQTSTKFVYLDMEEYRDLHLTADAFRRTLDRAEMESVKAGIALQAYIPDSYDVMTELIDWSKARVESGCRPITIRLVKGANMEMERVEASIGGWPATPFQEKVQTDANYKKMLRTLLRAAAQGHVRVGVASHNLFDISLALWWGSRHGSNDVNALDHVQFEMLEGMANHQRRALFECFPQMLLYAPACHREDFLNAIGYLIRRLDENTGKENFLRHTFCLDLESEAWNSLVKGFRESLAQVDTVPTQPRRKQNREMSPRQPPAAESWRQFVNEPDTDWSLEHHASWAQRIIDHWRPKCNEFAEVVPLAIGGEIREPGGLRRQVTSFDPSRPESVSCQFTQATRQDVTDAITVAHQDPDRWRGQDDQFRYDCLREAAHQMRQRRSDLIGAMVIDAGKLMTEADPEVSEAIDFAEFYPLSARPYRDRGAQPRGVVAVISPWNFPLAIPCGGIAAALAAGNTVILKPASDTVLPAYRLAQCFWDAGIPRSVLQLVPCSGSEAGQTLVTDERVDSVIMTGGTETAQKMLRMRPGLRLIAETGGKNATIVTSLADRDLAIKHVLKSAFGHSGQKCSATSLLLLQQEIYEDQRFRSALADAAESMHVGSAWDLRTRVGPMIRPPSGVLAKGLKELEPDEEWLVMPRRTTDNPQLYSPGIKWNVRAGSFTHRTELFGPVLGVMPFARLEQAIEIVNATGYGLTSGLESLDDREQELWKKSIHAGNLYINRPTTGAVVLRQPFGGIGSSGYGAGAKAGGPHYVVPLLRFDHPINTDELDSTWNAASQSPLVNSIVDEIKTQFDESLSVTRFAANAARFAKDVLRRGHDHFQLVGQDNIRSYRPVRQLRIRLVGHETAEQLIKSVVAAGAAECPVTYSMPIDCTDVMQELTKVIDRLALNPQCQWHPEWIEESDEALAAEISDGRLDRLRILGPPTCLPALIHQTCADAFLSVIAEAVCDEAEIELLRYINEQSLCHDYHRYGNLGRRSIAHQVELT